MPTLVLRGKDRNLNIVHARNVIVSVSKGKLWAGYRDLLKPKGVFISLCARV